MDERGQGRRMRGLADTRSQEDPISSEGMIEKMRACASGVTPVRFCGHVLTKHARAYPTRTYTPIHAPVGVVGRRENTTTVSHSSTLRLTKSRYPFVPSRVSFSLRDYTSHKKDGVYRGQTRSNPKERKSSLTRRGIGINCGRKRGFVMRGKFVSAA